jgi:hypothetical protein
MLQVAAELQDKAVGSALFTLLQILLRQGFS